MQWLENEVALVTGAGSGIGKAVVQRFVEEGAKVVAFDLSEDRLKALKEDLGGVAVVQGDVRRLDDNRKAVATASSRSSSATPEFMTGAGNWKDCRTRSWKTATMRFWGSISRATCWAPRPRCRS
jgi:NADP-dependent 3-hydroxy acid dehydrogenase YdfG